MARTLRNIAVHLLTGSFGRVTAFALDLTIFGAAYLAHRLTGRPLPGETVAGETVAGETVAGE